MSKSITFFKYQGTGNDFVIIDGMTSINESLSIEEIKKLCDRRFGIGADGLIILRASETHDFYMDYYNSDGRPSTMCGNGGRCLVKFAYDLGYISSNTVFEAVDGLHAAEIKNDLVSLHMIDVNNILINDEGAYIINTGSPHYVKFIQNETELANIVEFGKQIRYSDKYTNEGINVNLILEKGDSLIAMSTYERGVEDETFSCGTGVTAASLALAHRKNLNNEIIVDTKGGQLSVSFERINDNFSNILLTGPAMMVFKGTINF